MKEKFRKVSPKDYAEKLKEEYNRNSEKWYESVIPKSAADELIARTGGDYSLIWHEHCDKCFAAIDKNSKEAYVSADGYTWLCAECFEKSKKSEIE